MSLVTIVCDASHCPDTKVHGVGGWINAGPERGVLAVEDGFNLGLDNSTKAEMHAIVHTLQKGIDAKLVRNRDKVIITTDCQGCIDHANMNSNFLYMDELRSIQKAYGLRFDFRHVKGHSSKQDARSKANRHCDERAKRAMKGMRASAIAPARPEANEAKGQQCQGRKTARPTGRSWRPLTLASGLFARLAHRTGAGLGQGDRMIMVATVLFFC